MASPEKSDGAPALSWRKQLMFLFVLVVGLPVVVVMAAELGGRAYFHFKYGKPGKSYGIYMADPELGATHRPSSYNTNSVINNLGFRNVEDIPWEKPAGVQRVYCSGGSTTFCYNLPTEQAWPTRLQEDIRRRAGHEHDEVINGGQICFPVSSEFILGQRVIPKLKPDVVVMFTAVNELLAASIIDSQDGQSLDHLLQEQRWGVAPFHLDQARFLKRESVLVRFFDYKFKKWFEPKLTADYRGPDAKPEPTPPWVLANFEHTLRSYIEFLRANGVSRIVYTRWGDSGADSWFMSESRRIRDRGAEIAREMGVEIFDFAPVAAAHPQRPSLFIESGIHLTASGAELFARELDAFLMTPHEVTVHPVAAPPSGG